MDFCLQTDTRMVFTLTGYDKEDTESLIFCDIQIRKTAKDNSWQTRPGRRAFHRFRIPPTMPPPMNSKDAQIPKVHAKVALTVPESDIIILGNKNIKPIVIPMRKMEHRITQLNTLLWQFRRLGTSPSSKPSKALTIASISSSLTIASRSSCCCILIAACCMSRVCCEEFSIFCGIRCNLVMYNALLSRWLLDSMNRRDAITPDGYSMARVRNYYSTWMRTRGNNSLQLVGAVPSPESRVARRDTRHATADLGTVCAYDTV